MDGRGNQLFEWSSSRRLEKQLWQEHFFSLNTSKSTSITKFCPRIRGTSTAIINYPQISHEKNWWVEICRQLVLGGRKHIDILWVGA